MTYRYRYLRWNDAYTPGHPSNKYICPQCGKRTFVRVVDTKTGELLPEHVGKCDRSKKCGYSYSYSEYLQQHKGMTPISHQPRRSKQTINVIEMKKTVNYIDLPIMEATLQKDSDFREYMIDRFGQEQTSRVFNLYKVGADDYGNVIFWQLDTEGKVRGGKIVRFNRETGHRFHDNRAISWHHSTLKKRHILPNEWTISQTLFGSHLASDTTKTIALVESEKTALICAILIPDYIWMATGGKNNFNEDACQALKGRNVIIYPDLGAYSLWEAKAVTVARQVGFRYSLSDLLEKMATQTEREQQLDIADYLMKQ